MRPQPFAAMPDHLLRDLRLFASDIDDTLTDRDGIPAAVVDRLACLRRAGVVVWLVTGRCAAWGQAVAHYLPVDGVIVENGGALCRGEKLTLIADPALLGPGRAHLAAAFAELQRRVPAAVTTDDNIGRLTDWTFDRAPLTDADIDLAAAIARDAGLRFSVSSIHGHFFSGAYDKATTLGLVADELGISDRHQVLTLGDSANDEAMFDPAQFPLSVGVANVADYLARLAHVPAYILPEARAAGAVHLLDRLLGARLD